MGYSTEFQGCFMFSKPLSQAAMFGIGGFEGRDTRNFNNPEEYPGSYCQWVFNSDATGIRWDGGEKFYAYKEWVQYLHDRFLKPEGVTFIGEVVYQGDDIQDRGTLSFKDGKILDQTQEAVQETLNELIQFKNFVLQSKCVDEILEGWLQR